MATSGQSNVIFTDWDTLRFSWWIDSQSAANNETTLGWKLEVIATAYGYITPLYNRAWSVTIDGQTFSGRVNLSIQNNETELVASGTAIIKHNNDGSKSFSYSYKLNLNITFSDVKIGDVYSNGTGVLQHIPRAATITNAPNFTDEENPTITYSNPAGNAVTSLKACIASANGQTIYVPYRDISKTGTQYAFPLTEAEREALRLAAINSNTLAVKFDIATVIGGVTNNSHLNKTLSIVNAQPTLSPTVYATDDLTKTLTGDTNGNTLIKGCSSVYVGFGQRAYKEATIEKYYCRNGSQRLDGVSYGSLNNVDSGEFVFSVVDSRENTANKTINKNAIPYVKPSCSLSAVIDLDGETTAKITLNIKGSFWKGNFGAVENVLDVYYKYREKSGEWSNLQGINYTINSSDNTYSASGVITGLPYQNAYEIQAVVYDKVYQSGIFSNGTTLKLFPVFDWGENDFNFNVPVSILGKELDYIVEQGTSGEWEYIKWNSGRAELRLTQTYTTDIAVAWGSLFLTSKNGSATTIDRTYPFTFTEPPCATITAYSAGSPLLVAGNVCYANRISYYLLAAYSITNRSVNESIYIIGKWR